MFNITVSALLPKRDQDINQLPGTIPQQLECTLKIVSHDLVQLAAARRVFKDAVRPVTRPPYYAQVR